MGNCQSAKYKCLQFGQQWFSQLQTQHLVSKIGCFQAPWQPQATTALGLATGGCGCIPGSMQGCTAHSLGTWDGNSLPPCLVGMLALPKHPSGWLRAPLQPAALHACQGAGGQVQPAPHVSPHVAFKPHQCELVCLVVGSVFCQHNTCATANG